MLRPLTEANTATDVYYRIDGKTTLREGATINGNTAIITFNSDFNNIIYFIAVNSEKNGVTRENGPYTIKVDKALEGYAWKT